MADGRRLLPAPNRIRILTPIRLFRSSAFEYAYAPARFTIHSVGAGLAATTA